METSDDVAKCWLFSQACLCLTGRYLPTRTFMAVLVSILTFVDRRGCTNLQLANSIVASKTFKADVLRASSPNGEGTAILNGLNCLQSKGSTFISQLC